MTPFYQRGERDVLPWATGQFLLPSPPHLGGNAPQPHGWCPGERGQIPAEIVRPLSSLQVDPAKRAPALCALPSGAGVAGGERAPPGPSVQPLCLTEPPGPFPSWQIWNHPFPSEKSQRKTGTDVVKATDEVSLLFVPSLQRSWSRFLWGKPERRRAGPPSSLSKWLADYFWVPGFSLHKSWGRVFSRLTLPRCDRNRPTAPAALVEGGQHLTETGHPLLAVAAERAGLGLNKLCWFSMAGTFPQLWGKQKYIFEMLQKCAIMVCAKKEVLWTAESRQVFWNGLG